MPKPMTPEVREAKIATTAQMLDRTPADVRGPFPTGAALRRDLANASDAAVEARCDSLMAIAPEFEAAALPHVLIDAGNRASRHAAWRYRGFRGDSKEPALHEPGVRWPAGFDRATAIKALTAAGLAVMHPSASFKSLDAADDYWVCAALEQLLDSNFMSDRIGAQMTARGYQRSERGGWIHTASIAAINAAVTRTPAPRGDSAAPVVAAAAPLSHRDQWRHGLPYGQRGPSVPYGQRSPSTKPEDA